MKSRHLRWPLLLVVVGLIGSSTFPLLRQSWAAFAAAGDFVQGIWCGFWIGVEIVGVILLMRRKPPQFCPIPLRDQPQSRS